MPLALVYIQATAESTLKASTARLVTTETKQQPCTESFHGLDTWIQKVEFCLFVKRDTLLALVHWGM